MNNKKQTNGFSLRITTLALLLAVSLIMGWVEHMLPPLTPVPGVKLGLSNIPVLAALYFIDKRAACMLAAAKVLLSCVLFGGASALLYSALGMAASVCAMIACKSDGKATAVGVSACGGAAHISGQTAAAMLLTGTAGIWRMLPLMLALGTLTGAATGLVMNLLRPRLTGIAQIKGR